MAATKFVPLTAELIDEGEFLQNINEELSAIQKAMVLFCKQYGADAKKSVAKLKIEIAIKAEDPENDFLAVVTSISASLPKRPASISIAMTGETEANEPCLFVRQTGSDEVPPTQGKLFTRDGRTTPEANQES